MVECNQSLPIQDLLKRPRKERLESFRAFKVQHPLLLKAYNELWRAVRDSNRGSIIFTYGPTGVGKTTLLKRVGKQLTEIILDELKNGPERIPVVTAQLVAPTSGNFDWKDYFRRLLITLNEIMVDHKIDTRRWNYQGLDCSDESANNAQLLSSDHPSTRRMRFAGEQTLRHRKLLAVLLDDAQHLGILGSGRKLLDQLNTIKSLADKSETTHVLCGTYELLPMRNLNGQLSRRSIDVHFGRYHVQNEAHRLAFTNVLFTFQQRLPLIEAPDLVSMWDYFYERSIGCVGILKDWLTLSLAAALEEESPTLKIKYLERYAPSIAQCSVMLREAVDGEREVEEGKEERAHLRMSLGLDSESLKKGQEDSTARNVEQASRASTRRRTRRVGARKPVRDKVGKRVA